MENMILINHFPLRSNCYIKKLHLNKIFYNNSFDLLKYCYEYNLLQVIDYDQ